MRVKKFKDMVTKMDFSGKWITTEDFIEYKPIDIFHKEFADVKITPPENLKNYHVNFRKTFSLKKDGVYRIYISADDFYRLYINDRFVGIGPAPAYYNQYKYNSYDITDFLVDGENVIAAEVYYQGVINRVTNSGDNRMGVIADLYCSGEFIFGTDSSWEYKRAEEYSGKETGYSTMFLENIDFNLKDKDWRKPGKADGFRNSVVNENDDHVFFGEVPAVEVYKIKPKIFKKLSEGKYFLDFGHEIAGSISMRIKGVRGETATLKYGEETVDNEPFTVRYKMRCNCDYEEKCILSGTEDVFEFYDYRGFRYVNIETEQAQIKEVYAEVRHHTFDDDKCSFECSDKLLEKIWDICKNTLKYGTQEGFLDCLTREKGQYLGDFTVSGLAYLYLTGDTEIYKKAMFDFAASQNICEGMMAVAPGGVMQEIADYSLQFPLQLLNYYKYTNDKNTLSVLLPAAEKVIHYFERYERADGLLYGVGEKWNMVDWPINLRDSYDCVTEQGKAPGQCHNVINAFYTGAVICMEEIKDILGEKHDNKSEKLKSAFINAFYNKEKKLFTDTEKSEHSSLHSNAVAAFFGITPHEAKQETVDFIMKKGLCCGVYMSYFVLKALAVLGAYKEEYELLTNTSEHSWANMIREGAVACFEAWGKEQKWNTSLCHPWACSPVIVIAEDLMGIKGSTFKDGIPDYTPKFPDGISAKLRLPAGGKVSQFAFSIH